MNKKAIWLIIILMSASLIGVIIIQFFWIKWSVNLDEKNFNDKVYIALSRTRESLFNNYREKIKIKDFIEKSDNTERISSILSGIKSPKERRKAELGISRNLTLIKPSDFIENIDISELDFFIKRDMEEQGIDLKYDYGVYANESRSFIIFNGNYVSDISNTEQASSIETNQSLEDTEYKVMLSENEANTPGYLGVYFPHKTGWLWASVLPIMLSSLLFTGLILYCFAYTIYVIFRQKQVSEMKNDFINNMTHEFKTPIATISLATDAIPMVMKDQSKVDKFIGIIKQENKRMLSQVEKVLQISLLEKKDFELKIGEVDLHQVIKQAAENTSLVIQKRGGKLLTDLQAKTSILEGDITHISNIIYNLLDNANKYSSEIPEIFVSSRNVNRGIEVIVKDNGIGIPKESLKHIFDKFYRVHTGNLHDVKGFGLGLSYVKAMMDAHHGTIKVKSELGKGSSFILYFPFKQSKNN